MRESPAAKPIGIGVIGLGFMGATHIRAYHAAAAAGFPCRLAAVSDASVERLSGAMANAGNLGAGLADWLFDAALVHAHADAADLIADDSVDLVSICTYTDSHVDLAVAAMSAGKHVLVEKPVARNSRDVERLAVAARRTGRLCMPAMCMRFWPGWDWLRDRIADGSLGAVRSATFQRLGSQPGWAQAFYGDLARSGGALLDLHIHDADFIHWCFGWDGAAVTVSTTGSPRHLTTQYRFAGGPAHLTAEAAWDLAPNAGFRMRYLVNFDRATAEFDLMRSPQLMVHDGAGSRAIELAATTGYDGEVRHILSAIRDGRTDLAATLDESIKVMRMLEAEQASMESGTVARVR
jgi:predicted dehydrogenase